MISDSSPKSSLNLNRLRNLRDLMEGYHGDEPFHHYLKNYFRNHKQFGSTDRRIYREWSYELLRLGKALPKEDLYIRLAVAIYLMNGNSGFPFGDVGADPIGNLPKAGNVEHRIEHLQTLFPTFKINDLFPYDLPLTGNLQRSDYALSMLSQPEVWIRISQQRVDEVKEILSAKAIPWQTDSLNSNAIAVHPASDLKSFDYFNKGYFEIQDRSSQECGLAIPAGNDQHWWDACCGAGGKSLQLLDRFPGVRITATDKRQSVFNEFAQRLQRSGHHDIPMNVMDLETDPIPFQKESFDGILLDVPCTGSGTWGRTPEWLTQFDQQTIRLFAERQKLIIAKVVPYLKSGQSLMYITCSVFREENEFVADHICENHPLKLVKQRFVNGSRLLSDSMYYAIFEKL